MRPEIDLLMRCACSELVADADENIRKLLQRNIDWDVLLGMARLHGIEAPTASALDAHTEVVPQVFRDKLQDYVRKNSEVNRQLTDILIELMPGFEEAGVRVMPFKGPEMAVTVSETFVHRPYNDVDLLIDARDARASIDLLTQQGYDLKYGGTWDESEFRWSHGETFKTPGMGYEVDLHWEFLPVRTFGCEFPFEQLWERRTVVTLQGREIPSPSLEELFLMLCIHGCKHRWILFKWIRDIAVISNLDSQPDWNAVKRRASEMGAVRMVALSLHLVGELLGATVPEIATREFPADRRVRSLARDIRSYMVAEMEYAPSGRQRHKFYLQMRERRRDRIRYSIYLAKRVTDPTRWQLPQSAFFSVLFALAWPIWLVVRGLRTSLRGRRTRPNT